MLRSFDMRQQTDAMMHFDLMMGKCTRKTGNAAIPGGSGEASKDAGVPSAPRQPRDHD